MNNVGVDTAGLEEPTEETVKGTTDPEAPTVIFDTTLKAVKPGC